MITLLKLSFEKYIFLAEPQNAQEATIEAIEAQRATNPGNEMEHTTQEPQIAAANVSPLLMNRLLGYGNPRTAPIQLGEGAPNFPADVHEDSARFSLHSGDRVENTTDSIWSVRELVNISPGKNIRLQNIPKSIKYLHLTIFQMKPLL